VVTALQENGSSIAATGSCHDANSNGLGKSKYNLRAASHSGNSNQAEPRKAL